MGNDEEVANSAVIFIKASERVATLTSAEIDQLHAARGKGPRSEDPRG